MATCVNCDKEWNSWGNGDSFCSDECEGEHLNKIHLMLGKLVAISSPDARSLLMSIIVNADNIKELSSYLIHLPEWPGYLQNEKKKTM